MSDETMTAETLTDLLSEALNLSLGYRVLDKQHDALEIPTLDAYDDPAQALADLQARKENQAKRDALSNQMCAIGDRLTEIARALILANLQDVWLRYDGHGIRTIYRGTRPRIEITDWPPPAPELESAPEPEAPSDYMQMARNAFYEGDGNTTAITYALLAIAEELRALNHDGIYTLHT